jgi:alkanesulfonate monooxygenase SsuD/methylene tetrahydromethanopterin reductase-like flavin-dependent oxidoreductase (luciferase family)
VRIGISMPFKDGDGRPLDAAGIAARAAMVEQAGLDGVWIQDSLIPGVMRPEPLLWLTPAAAATTSIEIGTSIFIVPLRHPVDLAQRFLTLRALTNDRFTAGVGAGSSKPSHDSVGVDFHQRFRLLYDEMDTIRRLCDGETVGAANLDPWPSVKGGPRFVIGAWHSEASLRRAVREYDGWMCSAGRTNLETMSEAVKRYRALGGQRAMVSTCPVDLSAPTQPMGDDDPFNLMCDPAEAGRRLERLAALGFDDVLLVKRDHTGRTKMFETDLHADEIAQVRALLPRDETRPWHADGAPRARPASGPPAGTGGPAQEARGGRADAFDRLVTSVARDGDGKVTAVGGDFGVRSRASVIIDIQNGAHTYHLEAGGRRVDVLVTQQDGRRQLSAPDGADGADALAGLPAAEGAAR